MRGGGEGFPPGFSSGLFVMNEMSSTHVTKMRRLMSVASI